MTAPVPYNPATSFAGLLGNTEGNKLDNEFTAIQLSLSQIISSLALIQRSDGALNNGIVTTDSLAPSVASKLP